MIRRYFFCLSFCLSLFLGWVASPQASAQQTPVVRFVREPNQLRILADQQPLATYVFRDKTISRPYFAHVRPPGGGQVTRNHPPVEGKDAIDHPTFHPGVWLAFGDLSGHDYWRLKAETKFVRFVEAPVGERGQGRFAVELAYRSTDAKSNVCREICRYHLYVQRGAFQLVWDSRFTSSEHDFAFGDQEEMGLGVRVATPLSVRRGGRILNSAGNVNEKQAWGKTARWCDYSGIIDGHRAGILIAPDPQNFRPCWFHARDYGFVAANPFGRRAFTKGETSRVVARKGDPFRLRFALLFYWGQDEKPLNAERSARDLLNRLPSR